MSLDYERGTTGEESAGLRTGSASNSSSMTSSRRTSLTLLLLALIALLILDSFTTKYTEHWVLSFLDWVAAHPFLGVLAIVVVYIVATICFVPGSVLTIGAGFAMAQATGSWVSGWILSSVVRFGRSRCVLVSAAS